jgi:hypothetical protein
VRARSCEGGKQQLNGSMSVWQAIDASEAAELPEYLTGLGDATVRQGEQAVAIRIHGPHGGTIEDVRIDGKAVAARPDTLDGRPVATLYIFVESTKDVIVNWSMTSGDGQDGDPELSMTPSVVPGDKDAVTASAC